MSALEDALGELLARPEADAILPPAPTYPRGWEPRVEQDASEAFIVTAPRPTGTPEPAETEVLEAAGLDPSFWSVTGIRRSRWEAPCGEGETRTLESTRVTAVRRVCTGVEPLDFEHLMDEVRALEPIPPHAFVGTAGTFVVLLSDWQIGKGENGGPEATVARIKQSLRAKIQQLHNMIALNRAPSRIVLLGLGDIVEGCSGWYPMQEWQVTLTQREQMNVTRRLFISVIREFSAFGIPVLVTGVAGNHGENRKNGKAFTTFGDNLDVALLEQVWDVVKEAPEAFGDVSFIIPGDELSLALDLDGIRLGAVHGHQFRGGTTAAAKAVNWWKGQALGDQACGAAQILVSGHLHHLSVVNFGLRTHIQAPAMDGGSQWFREIAGVSDASGMLSFMVGSNLGPLGWSDLDLS